MPNPIYMPPDQSAWGNIVKPAAEQSSNFMWQMLGQAMKNRMMQQQLAEQRRYEEGQDTLKHTRSKELATHRAQEEGKARNYAPQKFTVDIEGQNYEVSLPIKNVDGQPVLGEPRVIGKSKAPSPLVKLNQNINLNPALKKLIDKQGELIIKERDEMQLQSNSLNTIAEAKRMLDKGIITGKFADFEVGVGKTLQKLGILDKDNPLLANTEAYAATMGRQVGMIIKQFGSGTGLSDADREYAEKIAGGRITVNEAAIRRLLDINERIVRANINVYNKKADQVMSRPGAKDMLYDLRITPPKTYGPSSQPESGPTSKSESKKLPPAELKVGKVYRNKAGERRRFLGNGQWGAP